MVLVSATMLVGTCTLYSRCERLGSPEKHGLDGRCSGDCDGCGWDYYGNGGDGRYGCGATSGTSNGSCYGGGGATGNSGVGSGTEAGLLLFGVALLLLGAVFSVVGSWRSAGPAPLLKMHIPIQCQRLNVPYVSLTQSTKIKVGT